ncbi:hypothetical protein [Spirillospora sp. NPDC047279]|uniref:hypothetical protein n=1 Tax=Spirillospora sp. NPDC047279 TaxID=3155478 RepID=UPI0033EAEA36
MERRTDRAAAFCVLTAVFVVPAAVLAVVRSGAVAAPDPGRTWSPAAAGPAPLGRPAGARPGGRALGGGRPGGGRPAVTVVLGRGGAVPLRSFGRVTDVRLSGGPDGDYEHVTEVALVRLDPAFAMRATGTRISRRNGVLTRAARRVVVRGRTMRTFDGGRWRTTRLTAAQVAALRAGSDPRRLTWLVRAAPGAEAAGPDRYGSIRFGARTAAGGIRALLPGNAAAEVRRALPAGTVVDVELWADTEGRPNWIGLGATGPGRVLSGSVAFRSYG